VSSILLIFHYINLIINITAWDQDRISSANDVPNKLTKLNKTLPPLSSSLSPSHEQLSTSLPHSLAYSRPSTTSHTIHGGRESAFAHSSGLLHSSTPNPLYGHDEFSGQWVGSRSLDNGIEKGEGEKPISRSFEKDSDESDIRFIDSGSILSADDLNSSQESSGGRLSSAVASSAMTINQFDVDNFVRISSPPRALILAGSATFVLFSHGTEVYIYSNCPLNITYHND